MSRSLILSNSTLCVALDNRATVRDIYYPHVGLEDHLRGHYVHRVGVWCEGRISWLSSGEWEISMSCEEGALVGVTTAHHPELNVTLTLTDFVCHDKNVFIRRVTVTNDIDREREIKLYFSQQFEIHKMHGSDTAYFDPASHSVIHYKGRRVFLMSGTLEKKGFADYATGRANFHGQEGSHRDADDGELSKNAIEHGPADSIIGFYATYAPHESRLCDYWLIAAQTIPEALTAHSALKKATPAKLLKTTQAFWNKWVDSCSDRLQSLDDEGKGLYQKSLMYMRAHADSAGGIIASTDSDMFQYGIDTYSYVWMRDSAYVALALLAAGDANIAHRFFEFCKKVITDNGYFMHKYSPDGSLGSSWHPWFKDGEAQLPIQEDETAIVIYALKEHIARTKDIEYLESVYEPLVEKSAQFLIAYRDPKTKLPLPSYDLWERKRGVSTYTSATVYGGLVAAAELSAMLGKEKNEKAFMKAAREIQKGIMEHLWNAETEQFYNMYIDKGEGREYDATIDISSVYGVFLFNVLEKNDPRLKTAFEKTVSHLSSGVAIGGIPRFENDDYYHIDGPATGNPWFLTTLWHAEYLIANAENEDDLEKVRAIFEWVKKHALSTGVLSEQLNPNTGEQVCAGPLTWAHASYVSTVLSYLEKKDSLA